MDKVIKKIVGDSTKQLEKSLIKILEETAVPMVKEIILKDYDNLLNDVANPKSLLAPERYMDEFEKRLNQFYFVRKTAKGVRFVSPDMENFNFRGILGPIETILEGLSGKYVEVELEDYRKATKKQTYRGEYRKVYLIKYSSEVKKWEKTLNKKFDEYAFSNTPPIDIFGSAEEFVKDDLDTWIEEAIIEAQREIK